MRPKCVFSCPVTWDTCLPVPDILERSGCLTVSILEQSPSHRRASLLFLRTIGAQLDGLSEHMLPAQMQWKCEQSPFCSIHFWCGTCLWTVQNMVCPSACQLNTADMSLRIPLLGWKVLDTLGNYVFKETHQWDYRKMISARYEHVYIYESNITLSQTQSSGEKHVLSYGEIIYRSQQSLYDSITSMGSL